MKQVARDLIDWCEGHDLYYVKNFMRQERRGTSFHMRYRRWYELDVFLCNNCKVSVDSDTSAHALRSSATEPIACGNTCEVSVDSDTSAHALRSSATEPIAC